MKLIKNIFIFSLLLLCVIGAGDVWAAYGPGDYIIYTWGYADIMRNMLSAVAGMLNSNGFLAVFKTAVLLGMLVVSATLMFGGRLTGMALGVKFLIIVLLNVLLHSAPYNTYISDISKTTGSAQLDAQPVLGPRGERVPVIIAFPLYVISNIEKGLYDIFKDTLARTQGGVAAQNRRTLPISTSLNLLLATSSYRITDINLNRSLDSFVTNCIVPDMISGYYDMDAMGKSPNFYNEWQDVHRMRITNYYDKNRNDSDGWIIDCQDAYARISADLNRATGVNGEAFKQIAASAGLASDAAIHQQLGIISKELLNYTGDTASLMRNAIAINSFNSTYISLAAEAGVQMAGLNYGQVKAQEVARMNSTLSAIMAKKYLPLAKGYLSVIFVAIIPLILIIGLAIGSFKKPAAMICGLLVALSLWGIGDQLLDFIITIRIGGLLQSTGGLSLANQPVIDMGILDALSLSLGMYWMIPTLSFAIATMSGFAANSVMGGIGSSVMSGVGSAVTEAAMGSRSMGVVRENMINTNKYDAARVDSMGVSSSVKDGLSKETMNKDSTDLTTMVQGMEGNLKWEAKNNMRNGEGQIGDDYVKVTQYMGEDGQWHNQEVKTTYGNSGVSIDNDRGGKIHLGAGATSTQYADGTISYKGVSDKYGQVDASYGANGEVGMINGMKGHEFFNKHNSINEDLYKDITNVSNEYTGAMEINGQQAWGRYAYDKDKGQGVFSGQIGNDKVDMTLNNVKDFKIDNRGEHNSLASLKGDVGQMKVDGSQMTTTGTSVENLGNTHNYNTDSIYQNGVRSHRDGNGEYAGLVKDYDNLKHLKAYADANPENAKAQNLYKEAADDFSSKAAGFVTAASGAVQKEFSADKAFQEQYQFGKDHTEGTSSENSMSWTTSLSAGVKGGDTFSSIKNTIGSLFNANVGINTNIQSSDKISNTNSSQESFGNAQSSTSNIRDNLIINNVANNLMESLENGSSAKDFYSNLGNRDNYIPSKKK